MDGFRFYSLSDGYKALLIDSAAIGVVARGRKLLVQREPLLRLLDAVVVEFMGNLARAQGPQQIAPNVIRKLADVNRDIGGGAHAKLFLRKLDIKQPINQHAGHGNIQPKRQGPARDFFVLVETLAQRTGEGDKNHWHDDHGESFMRDENGEVNGAKPGWILEMGHALVQHVDPITVIREIAGQEERGNAERRNHARPMGGDIFLADKDKTGGQKNRAQAVERGVNGRQVVDAHGARSNRRMSKRSLGRTVLSQSTSLPPV